MSTPAPAAWSRPVLAVLLLSAVLSIWIALRYPLVDPDEGRNAEIAREMAADGDFVIPHLAGMPYLDKPPALFAAGALAIKVLGPVPLAVRLPAMIAAFATLLVLARAAARLEPAGHGARLLAFTAAAPLFAVLSAYVIFDMPLALCVTVVWTGVALERARGPSAAHRAAIFAAVTLGVLIKGPIMLAWALGGSLGAALLVRGRGPLRWLGWWPGWALLLVVAGGWFALALGRHPEYAHYAFVEESFERFSSGTFRREQPWWFVPAVLAGGALPWSLATPWGRPRSDASRIAAGFVLFAAVFFTLSRSKLVTYLLPAIPALAWWAAEAWGRRGRLPHPLVAALFLAPLVLTAGSPWLVRYARSQSGEPLARALARTGAATVIYQDCYSPGSDFLLNRRSAVVSAGGHVLASNYVVRYRELLQERGQWLLFSAPEDAPAAEAVVVPVRRADDARRRYGAPFFEDERFAAFRRGAAR